MGIFKRPLWLIILLHIFYNWRDKQKYHRSCFKRSAGYRHKKLNISQSLEYIEQIFRDYLRYGNLDRKDIQGKRILEIGPGDNFAVALSFLSEGAEKVICLDKFHYENRDRNMERNIYSEIIKGLSEEKRSLLSSVINLNSGIEFNNEKFQYITGYGIERSWELFGENTFDLIISRAVLEHVDNPETAFKAMDKMLKPDAIMIHGIDFRDHGIFSSKGWNPLTFLTISKSTYDKMIKNSGKPNRAFADFYINTLNSMNYSNKYYISGILGVDERLFPAKEKIEYNIDYFDDTLNLLNEIRPKLQDEFKNITDEILMIETMFLFAKKPLK
jgi:SAM-dependent methyltransferase